MLTLKERSQWYNQFIRHLERHPADVPVGIIMGIVIAGLAWSVIGPVVVHRVADTDPLAWSAGGEALWSTVILFRF